MILPGDPPRLFALPPGVDFAAEVARGLALRMAGAAPEAWADVTILANTPRMARAISRALEAGPPRILPRIGLVTDLSGPAAAPPPDPLRARLELARLVAALLARAPDIAPAENALALADSLIALVSEMEGEGVAPDAIAALDVSDQSGHWARALAFFDVVRDWLALSADTAEGRRRADVLALVARWEHSPPPGPVIVAGSTGSRGTTAILLSAVARLPQGAVILPGFDFDLPPAVWDRLEDARTAEDHPQFRFRRLCDALGIAPGTVQRWTEATPARPARNRLVSLALRPAPVTDRWIAEGPALGPLVPATVGITLLEAPTPQIEAEAIALRLRHAVAAGETAALITPDRMLTRQVAAALDRWGILADDSAGVPLALTPPGRFLRQVAALRAPRPAAVDVVALLKHPLCHSERDDRGAHLLHTQTLELRLRRAGLPHVDDGALAPLRAAGAADWCDWVAGCLAQAVPPAGPAPLSVHAAAFLGLAQGLAAGPGAAGAGGLWDMAAGRAARAVVEALLRNADAGGAMTAHAFAVLVDDLMAGEEVREPTAGHPGILFRGTLEARVEAADLVILGSLNDGTWPGLPAADPWLNRAMRARSGLLLPERQIGLSAHDFQQAIAAPQVWLTRAVRSDSAETVPSRWLARLTNLLHGLPDQGGRDALTAMRAEGARWIAGARAMARPEGRVPPAPRPSPAPPLALRPRQLSVSAVQTLLRDPYAIYAERVLRLRKLDPLTLGPDARLRGTVLHAVLERALTEGPPPDDPAARATLLHIAAEVLDHACPWPMVRRLWLGRLTRVADWFLSGEVERRATATPRLFETRGQAEVPGTGVTIVAKADRIDLTAAGHAVIYDYKTGKPPSVKQQGAFDKQLLIEAALAENGAFAALGRVQVASAAYLGLSNDPEVVAAPLADHPPAQVWAELATLLTAWADPGRGYTARMAMPREETPGDFDHLSRFGEWDRTTPATRLLLE